MAVIVALAKTDELIVSTLHGKVFPSLDPQWQQHKKCGRCNQLRPVKIIAGQQAQEEINAVVFLRQDEGKNKAVERRRNGAIKVSM